VSWPPSPRTKWDCAQYARAGGAPRRRATASHIFLCGGSEVGSRLIEQHPRRSTAKQARRCTPLKLAPRQSRHRSDPRSANPSQRPWHEDSPRRHRAGGTRANPSARFVPTDHLAAVQVGGKGCCARHARRRARYRGSRLTTPPLQSQSIRRESSRGRENARNRSIYRAVGSDAGGPGPVWMSSDTSSRTAR